MAKKIIFSVIFVVVLLIGSLFTYTSLTMKPAKSSPLDEDIYILRNGFVNFFLIKGDRGYIAIDAGIDSKKVLKELKNFKIDPRDIHSVFLTHTDEDHAGGISAFPESKIYIPELEEPMILGKDTRKIFGKESSGISPLASMAYTVIPTDEQLSIDGILLQSISTPGHSNGSTSYIINNTYAFVGDMAVIANNHLTPLPSFINNDQTQARLTADSFEQNFSHLKIIATAHDGLLYLNGE